MSGGNPETKQGDRAVAADSPAHLTHAGADAAAATSIADVLRAMRLLAPEAEQRAMLAARESGERLDRVVTRLGLVSETALAEAVAHATGLDLLPADRLPRELPSDHALSPAFLRENRVVPVAVAENRVTVAVADPFDRFVLQALEFVFARPIALAIARSGDIEAAVDRIQGAAGQTPDAADEFIDADDVERLKDLVSDAPVIRAVNRLIAQASDARASDVHIEPAEDRLAVRFRIDGQLHERDPLPAALRAPLVSRIKIMAGLNVAERRLPQDGRLRIAVRGHEIDLRVATAPSIHGESVVMRILDRSRLPLDLAALGFAPGVAHALQTAVTRPHGIVLVTGPTGSGKTTTLYAALAELNTAERKLLTVEDPIEYRLAGVQQTQVNPQIGLTFGTALRSFLRLDPDVIMVGEIRDSETADIAVQAALTGHMILATLHTNSAAGAVTRLIDMGVEPFLLGSVLGGVLAQRLVRRLCPHCREAYEAPQALLAELGLPGHPPVIFHRPVGCDRCNGSGYAGRIALTEFLTVDDGIAQLILQRADSRRIAEAARETGMASLFDDGLAKARAGLIAVHDVLRVAEAE